MTREAALKIIRGTSLEELKRLTVQAVQTLTYDFTHEEVARAFIAKGATLDEQKNVFEWIAYVWRSCKGHSTGIPFFLEDIQVYLNLGKLIVDPEAVSTPPTPAPPPPQAPLQEDAQAELEKLRTELRKIKAQNSALRKENSALREELKAERSLVFDPIDTEGHGTVRLELLRQLMLGCGADLKKHGNKEIAAQLMNAITGLAPKTCANYLSDPGINHTEHEEIILKLNSQLRALGIEIIL